MQRGRIVAIYIEKRNICVILIKMKIILKRVSNYFDLVCELYIQFYSLDLVAAKEGSLLPSVALIRKVFGGL